MSNYKSIDDFILEPLPIKKELEILFHSDENLIIFDIGACECEDSIRYSNMFINASIFSFEPLPKNAISCLSNIERHQKLNITLTQVAFSDKVGDALFHISSGHPDHIIKNSNWDYGNKSSSLLEPNKESDHFDWLKFEDTIKVKTDTISNFCMQNKISEIDIIHMDVQGAELMVLNGAKNFIQNIKCIWMEVEKIELYKGQPLKTTVENYMKANNFIKVIDTVDEISGDQLYINKNSFNRNTITKIKKSRPKSSLIKRVVRKLKLLFK